MNISKDEGLINEINEQQFILLTSVFTAAPNTQAFFEDEWQNEERIFLNPNEGVRDQLSYIRNLPHLFN